MDKILKMATLPALSQMACYVVVLIAIVSLGLHFQRVLNPFRLTGMIRQKIRAWMYLPYGVELIQAGYAKVSRS